MGMNMVSKGVQNVIDYLQTDYPDICRHGHLRSVDTLLKVTVQIAWTKYLNDEEWILLFLLGLFLSPGPELKPLTVGTPIISPVTSVAVTSLATTPDVGIPKTPVSVLLVQPENKGQVLGPSFNFMVNF
ncbi:3-hydroxy-3-methylglutaryl-coenzyme A reductase 3-like protein [Tanacetum coccineum]